MLNTPQHTTTAASLWILCLITHLTSEPGAKDTTTPHIGRAPGVACAILLLRIKVKLLMHNTRSFSGATGGLPLVTVMKRFSAYALASVLAAPAAAAPPTVLLERLTWVEVEHAIADGATTIIIPTGGTEQNGPHMALGKHNVIVAHAAEQIALRLGDALVAPVVAYVPEGDVTDPRGHMNFAGTITLPQKYFVKLIEYAARSFKLHGFRDIVLLGDSGGNWAGLEIAAAKLNAKWADSGVGVHYIKGFSRGRVFQDWLIEQGESDKTIGTHAGIMDTSVMLAVDPSMVRPDKLAPSYDFDRTGVHGDPTRASADYGRVGLEFQIEGAIEEILRKISGKE